MTAKLGRGTGVQDRVRLALQVGAVALAVVLGLLAVTMPLAFEASQHRIAARYPRFAPAGDSGEVTGSTLTLGMADELHHGRTVTLWLVTATDPDAPLPVGVAALPAAGHMVVSPAFQAALEREDSLRRRHPGIVDGVVGPAGLATPEELFALVGVPDAVGESVVDFGVPLEAVAGLAGRDAGSLVASEVLVLVVLPLLGFLVVASRMAVGVRMIRVAALRLLGLTVRDCARLQGRQLAIVVATGATLGCVGYQPFSAALGMSGITGMSWFPEDTTAWWPVLVAIVVGITVAGRYFGRWSTQAALNGPVRGRAPREWPSWLFWGAAAVAIVCAGFLATMWAIFGSLKQWHQLSVQYSVLAAWLALAGLVLVLSAQLTTRLVARLLRSDSVAIPQLRLGLRLALAKAPGTMASQVAMGLLIVIAGFSTVVTGTMAAVATVSGEPVSVSVHANELGGTEQEALADLLRSGHYQGYATVYGKYVRGGTTENAGVEVLIADCAVATQGARNDCGHDPVVLAATGERVTLKTGSSLRVGLADGRKAEIKIPDRVVTVDDLPWSGMLLVSPAGAAWLGQVASIQFEFVVPPTGDAYDNLLARLSLDSPSAQVTTAIGDPEARGFFIQQQSLLRTFTAIGFLFCVFAMCLAGISMGQDQLRSITALQLIGLTRTRLRVSFAISKALPALIATSSIAIVTGVGGQALLAVVGVGAQPDPVLWTQTLAATIVAVVMAATMGALLIGRLDLTKSDARE